MRGQRDERVGSENFERRRTESELIEILLLSAAPSWASGLVAAVPAGVHEIGVLVCDPSSSCVDEAAWLAGQPGTGSFVRLELVLDRQEWGEILAVADEGYGSGPTAVEQAVAEARKHAAAGAWELVDGRLDDAARALRETARTLPNATLFDLWWLRGAAALHRGRGSEGAAFAQAVAVAWNRQPALPVGSDEPATAAYYAAMRDVIAAGTATLRLSESAGATWTLDGVEIGPGPAELIVFPGEHRVTANRPGAAWAATVRLAVRGREEVVPVFDPPPDAAALAFDIADAVATLTAATDTSQALSAWCAVADLHLLRVYLVGRPSRRAPFTVRSAVYDPHARTWRPASP